MLTNAFTIRQIAKYCNKYSPPKLTQNQNFFLWHESGEIAHALPLLLGIMVFAGFAVSVELKRFFAKQPDKRMEIICFI